MDNYSTMKAAKPSRRETRVYAAIAAVLVLGSLFTISYLDGRAAEQASRAQDIEQAVTEERAKVALWHAKYESLADESDGITVIAAEVKLQQEARR